MKQSLRHILLLISVIAGGITGASAQIADVVNGLTNVAIPAMRRGSGYKGYIEADFTEGFGRYRSNFVTLATSQGYMVNKWLYVGAGIGVDFLWSTVDTGWGSDWSASNPEWYAHEHTSTAVMIPVFTDFRFIIGGISNTSLYFNLRLGMAFLCTDSYVQIRDGYLTNRSYFYTQPAIGVRIPVSNDTPKKAIDIGIHYRLMASDYWANWQHNATINGIGVNIVYEW
ncbi:MAG: hypothetical protein NC204_03120 [Candidatus Amulumruptor caecigallinarius]|nr:hypothetical protein [Candidatus Amulumruptor caecigallinarius]